MGYHFRVILGIAVIGFLVLMTVATLEDRGIVDENTSMITGLMVAVLLMGAFSIRRKK